MWTFLQSGFFSLFLKDIHNVQLMLCVQAKSLCLCMSLELYKEQQRHLHVPQRQEIGKYRQQNSTPAWRLPGSFPPATPATTMARSNCTITSASSEYS